MTNIKNISSLKIETIDTYINKIKSIIDDNDEDKLDIYKSKFKQYLYSITSNMNIEERIQFYQNYLNTISKLIDNPDSYNYLLYIVTEIDDVFDLKYQLISKKVETLPSKNPLAWKYFKKTLIWLSTSSNSSITLLLKQFRVNIWNFSSGSSVAMKVSSLLLLNIYLKKFPIFIFGHFDCVRSLIIHIFKTNFYYEMKKPFISVLESCIDLLESSFRIHVIPIIKSIQQLLINNEIKCSINIIIKLLEKKPVLKNYITFTAIPLKKLESLILLPIIFVCSPSLFHENAIKAAFIIIDQILAGKQIEYFHIFKQFGDFCFLIDQNTLEKFSTIAKEISFLIFSQNYLKYDSCEYLFLSVISNSSKFKNNIFKKCNVISKLYVEGLKKYVSRYPYLNNAVISYLIPKLNERIFSNNPNDLIFAFHSLSLFHFDNQKTFTSLVLAYSSFLDSENKKVRLKCALFLLSQQDNYPHVNFRIFSYLARENNKKIRREIVKLIKVCSDIKLIDQYKSLLYDRDYKISNCVLKNLFKVKIAKRFIDNFLSNIIQTILLCNTYNIFYIQTLTVATKERNEIVIQHAKPLLQKLISYCNIVPVKDSILNLISLLLPFSPNTIEIKTLVYQIKIVLNNFSLNKSIIGVLNLLISALKHTNIIEYVDEFYNLLIEHSDIKDDQIQLKLIYIISQIGPRNYISEKNKIGISYFDGSLINKSIHLAISLILKILSDETESNQIQAIQSLVTILQYCSSNISCKELNPNKIISKVNDVLNKNNKLAIWNSLNIPDIITSFIKAFGEKSKPVIDTIIQIICENWDKYDKTISIQSFEIIAQSLPVIFEKYVQKVTILILTDINKYTIVEALSIYSIFKSYGNNIKIIDSILIPSLLSFIEILQYENNMIIEAFKILSEVIKNIHLDLFIYEILRTIFVAKQMDIKELNICLIDLIYEITILLKNKIFIYLSEIYKIFNCLIEEQEYQEILECIRNSIPINKFIVKRFNLMYKKNDIHNQIETDEKTNKYDIELDFSLPKQGWSIGDWNHWLEEICHIFFSRSRSFAISSCASLAQQNYYARNMLFPISIAIFSPNLKIDEVLKFVFSCKSIPAIVYKKIFSVIEYFEVYGLNIPVSYEILSEKAITIDNFPLAIRYTEYEFVENPNKVFAILINLYQNVGLSSSACSLLKTFENHEYIIDLSMELELWDYSLNYYEKKLIDFPDNELYKVGKMKCLENLGKYITLNKIASESENYKNFAATTALKLGKINDFMKLMEFSENNDLNKIIYCILKNNYDEAIKIINELRCGFKRKILSSFKNPYEKNFSLLSKSIILNQIELIINIKQDQETSEKLKSQYLKQYESVFDSLLESFVNTYDSLIISGIEFSNEELMPFYLKFIHVLSLSGESELLEIVLEKTHMNNKIKQIANGSTNEIEIYNYLNKLPNQFCITQANYYFGKWLLKNGNTKLAYSCLKLAFESNNKDSKIIFLWSRVNYIIGNYLEALKSLFIGMSISSADLSEHFIRTFSIITQHGSDEIYSSFLSSILDVDKIHFINILPQIVSCLNKDDVKLRNIVYKLIKILAKKEVNAVIYSLIVPYRDKKDKKYEIANKLIQTFQNQYPLLVNNILQFSNELIRITKTWHETCCTTMGNASRTFMVNKDPLNATKEINEVITEILSQEPQTIVEVNFSCNYFAKLKVAKAYLNHFIEYNDEISLQEAWNIFIRTFSSMNHFIEHFKSFNLYELSPFLSKLKSSIIAIPGNFNPLICIRSLKENIKIICSKQKPRKIQIIGDDGKKYIFLLKPNEDTRLDERVMQLLRLIRSLSKIKSIETYKIIPLTSDIGMIEWVRNCSSIFDTINENRIHSHFLTQSIEIKATFDFEPEFEKATIDRKVQAFLRGISTTKGNDLQKWLVQTSSNANNWLLRRINYTISYASACAYGYIIGLGDRHPQNILMIKNSAKLLNIDFGDCFDVTLTRDNYPEKVPFRLTRIMENALDASKTQGSFKSNMVSMINIMKKNKEQILELLEIFIYDPLISLKIKGEEIIEQIKNKLEGKISDKQSLVTEDQVDLLITQASDVKNLVSMYKGWYPWW